MFDKTYSGQLLQLFLRDLGVQQHLLKSYLIIQTQQFYTVSFNTYKNPDIKKN